MSVRQKKTARRSGVAGTESVLEHIGTPFVEGEEKKLDVVLKCDSVGSMEALIATVSAIREPRVRVGVIHAAVGAVTKSDLVMALTGSKLVIGFQVDVMPKLEPFIKDHGIEVRLYNVIYHLINDLRKIARSLIVPEVEEKTTGKARVIAMFKTRRGVILGCEVLEGILEVGRTFQVVAAMGPIHAGKIESLQIEKSSVKQATVGQQVGLRITGFDKAKLGDLVECYEIVKPKDGGSWRPRGTVIHSEG